MVGFTGFGFGMGVVDQLGFWWVLAVGCGFWWVMWWWVLVVMRRLSCGGGCDATMVWILVCLAVVDESFVLFMGLWCSDVVVVCGLFGYNGGS